MPMAELSEEQSVNFLRNALLVAGMELGKEGDHWPVIKSTIHSLMKDWEDLQTERNVFEEMKTHLYAQLEIMERGIVDCTPDLRADVEPKLKKIREIYDAYFSPVKEGLVNFDDSNMPTYMKRAKVITDTLEDDNES